MKKVWQVAPAALVAALALVAGAGARSATAPDVTQMVLQQADLPAAKVIDQGTVRRARYQAGYQRTFRFNAPYGRSGILLVRSEDDLAGAAAQPSAEAGRVERALASKAGRAAIVADWVKQGAKPADVKLGAVRHPAVGDHAVELPMSVKLKGRVLYLSLMYVRLDRVFAVLTLAGIRPVRPGESATIAHAVEGHVKQQLTPAVLAPPTIAGTAQIGQTLTASTGTWTPVAPAFTYQWQRCDANGACTAIAGATSSTYMVDPADAGFTLKVVVTATNRFGAPTSESTPTAAVPAPAPPPPPPGG